MGRRNLIEGATNPDESRSRTAHDQFRAECPPSSELQCIQPMGVMTGERPVKFELGTRHAAQARTRAIKTNSDSDDRWFESRNTTRPPQSECEFEYGFLMKGQVSKLEVTSCKFELSERKRIIDSQEPRHCSDADMWMFER